MQSCSASSASPGERRGAPASHSGCWVQRSSGVGADRAVQLVSKQQQCAPLRTKRAQMWVFFPRLEEQRGGKMRKEVSQVCKSALKTALGGVRNRLLLPTACTGAACCWCVCEGGGFCVCVCVFHAAPSQTAGAVCSWSPALSPSICCWSSHVGVRRWARHSTQSWASSDMQSTELQGAERVLGGLWVI